MYKQTKALNDAETMEDASFLIFLKRLGFKLIDTDPVFGIEEYLLEANGLKVYLIKDEKQPVIVTNLTFEVGSRNEGPDTSGLKHFLEHVSFDGSVNHDPEKGTGYDQTLATKMDGGQNNATTSLDRTNYWQQFIASLKNLKQALELEYDRWRPGGLLIRPEAVKLQIQVVRNEKERGLNKPDERLQQEVQKVAIGEHTYHGTTIGWTSSIETATPEKLRKDLETYYTPNNCVLTIVGNFDRKRTLSAVAKQLQKWPKSAQEIPQVTVREPKQHGAKTVTVKGGSDLPEVMIAWHNEQGTTDSSFDLLVAQALLGDATRPTTMIYKSLIEGDKPLATMAYAANMQLRDPFLFWVAAQAAPGVDLKVLEAKLLELVERLKTEPITAEQLKLAKSFLTKSMRIAISDPQVFAQQMTESIAISGSWKWLRDYASRIEAVTPERIQASIKRFCTVDNSTTGYCLPGNATESSTGAEGDDTSLLNAGASDDKAESRNKTRKRNKRSNSSDFPKTDFVHQTIPVDLPNGLRVLLTPIKGKGTASFASQTFAGNAFTPKGKSLVANLLTAILPTGTQKFSKADIAASFDMMGTSLNVASDTFICTIKSDVVSEDLEQLVSTIADMVQNPLVQESEFATQKAILTNALTDSQTNTAAMAENDLYRELYPPDSVYYSKTFPELIQELNGITTDDVKAFHKDCFSPNNTVIAITGDFDADKVKELVTREFGKWTGGARKQTAPPQTTLPAAAKTVPVNIDGKANTDVLMGIPTNVSLSSPGYFSYLLASNALGVDMFTTPLGALRVKYGLTYGIRCRFADATVGGAPWLITWSVNPKNLKQSIEIVDGIVADYVKDGVNDAVHNREVGRARGQFMINLRTFGGISSELSRHELLMPNNGAKFMDEYADNVAKVTTDQMKKAVSDLIRPDKLIRVVAGTVSAANS